MSGPPGPASLARTVHELVSHKTTSLASPPVTASCPSNEKARDTTWCPGLATSFTFWPAWRSQIRIGPLDPKATTLPSARSRPREYRVHTQDEHGFVVYGCPTRAACDRAHRRPASLRLERSRGRPPSRQSRLKWHRVVQRRSRERRCDPDSRWPSWRRPARRPDGKCCRRSCGPGPGHGRCGHPKVETPLPDRRRRAFGHPEKTRDRSPCFHDPRAIVRPPGISATNSAIRSSASLRAPGGGRRPFISSVKP